MSKTYKDRRDLDRTYKEIKDGLKQKRQERIERRKQKEKEVAELIMRDGFGG